MKVLIIDFQDSFTYNLSHYFESIGAEVVVIDENDLDLSQLEQHSHIVLSPGPGLPSEKNKLFKVIEAVRYKKPLLGVCLGMQGIAEFEGASLYNLSSVRHGIAEEILLNTNSILFKGLPEKINAGFYHSWAVSDIEKTGLIPISTNQAGVLMAFEDPVKKLFGVQFHPESIMTDLGKEILKNFLRFD